MHDVPPRTVLLIEDQPLIALEIEELLLAAGIDDVTCLRSCDEALNWLAEGSPSAVILDYSLTDGNGWPVLEICGKRGIPCIVHSAMPKPAGMENGPLGRIPWIDKPSDPDQLVKAVFSVMQARAQDL